jgi:predicted nucleic acid-binding protein
LNIVLDTNVVSELMRPRPEAVVTAWIKARANTELWITSVTEAELWFGARVLPAGKRRQGLEAALGLIFAEDLGGRTWPFDSAAAKVYADIMAKRRESGRPMSQFDGQIAAIARVHGAALATRNLVDFEGCDLVLHNPWAAASGP